MLCKKCITVCGDCGDVFTSYIADGERPLCISCRPYDSEKARSIVVGAPLSIVDPRVPGRHGTWESFEKAAEASGYLHIGDASTDELNRHITKKPRERKPVMTIDQFKDLRDHAAQNPDSLREKIGGKP